MDHNFFDTDLNMCHLLPESLMDNLLITLLSVIDNHDILPSRYNKKQRQFCLKWLVKFVLIFLTVQDSMLVFSSS